VPRADKAHHHRQQAERLRAVADAEDDPDLKGDILWLAQQYDALSKAAETELEMAVRHVAEQEERIARQEGLVERLQEIGAPLLDDARDLLAMMRGLLETMRAHVTRLSD
jgi:hypothetical protein